MVGTAEVATQLDHFVQSKLPYESLPPHLCKSVTVADWEKHVHRYSIKNQLRWRSNLVRKVAKDEKKYYEDVAKYSLEHYMLYPYHLSDVMVKGLKISAFKYYREMMRNLLTKEKSYDSLPNFTAADGVRLLGIGRNQFIDIMNQSRSKPFTLKSFKQTNRDHHIDELLPSCPVAHKIGHWWIVHVGSVGDGDIDVLMACSDQEKGIIDMLIDHGPMVACEMDRNILERLTVKGLVYLRVPISDDDCISVPPLEGFVMNRVLGDYLETLLYKLFVTVNESTTIAELASILQIPTQLIKNAISVYCRLGFAVKKGTEKIVRTDGREVHSSWHDTDDLGDENIPSMSVAVSDNTIRRETSHATPTAHQKRIGFIFDSSLTAFLMMGNLSQGLKTHAVTMFEVGKLSDESLDSFIAELIKVEEGNVMMGDAQRFFDHAIVLRNTLLFLRSGDGGLNSIGSESECEGRLKGGIKGAIGGLIEDTVEGEQLCTTDLRDCLGEIVSEKTCENAAMATSVSVDLNEGVDMMGRATRTPTSEKGLPEERIMIDLLRLESLYNLDTHTRTRVLSKNYRLLISMAPLSVDVRSLSITTPCHLGPPIHEINSPWFKLWLYKTLGEGPATVFLRQGHRLRRLPVMFHNCTQLTQTTLSHEPITIQTSNCLMAINETLRYSPVMLHHSHKKEGKDVVYVPLPVPPDMLNNPMSDQQFVKYCVDKGGSPSALKSDRKWQCSLPCIQRLKHHVDLIHNCGYVILQREDRHHLTETIPDTSLRARPSTDDAEMDTEDQPDADKCADGYVVVDETSTSAHSKGWLVYDIKFGIPLFDRAINTTVCEEMAKQNFFEENALLAQSRSSKALTLALLDFIADHVDMNPEAAITGTYTPLPTKSLVYEHGFTVSEFISTLNG
eukprot:CFRG5843T1